MSKIEKIFYGILASLPIFVGLLYTVGLNYLAGYLKAFDISFELLKFNFNDTIYFGFMTLGIICIVIIKLVIIMWLFIFTGKILFYFFSKKVSLVKYYIKFNKYPVSKELEKIVLRYMVIALMCLSLLFSAFLFVIFDKCAYYLGVSMGSEIRKDHDATFEKLNNKEELDDPPLILEIKNSTTNKIERKIGFIIFSDERFLAYYSKPGDLLITPISNGLDIQGGKFDCHKVDKFSPFKKFLINIWNYLLHL